MAFLNIYCSPRPYKFFQQPTLLYPLISFPPLCWQLTTLKSPLKCSCGFRLLSLKVPLKAFSFDATDQAGNWLGLLSTAVVCHYVEDKYGFHHEWNGTKKNLGYPLLCNHWPRDRADSIKWWWWCLWLCWVSTTNHPTPKPHIHTPQPTSSCSDRDQGSEIRAGRKNDLFWFIQCGLSDVRQSHCCQCCDSLVAVWTLSKPSSERKASDVAQS